MTTKPFVACKKLLLALTLLSSFSLYAQDCGGVSLKSLVACEKLADGNFISITDKDEEIVVSLIKNKSVITSEEGLGLAMLDIRAEGVVRTHTLKTIGSDEFLILRTASDTMGLLWVVKASNNKLALMNHTSSAGVDEFLITTHIESSADVIKDEIHIKDTFFEAIYKIEKDKLSQIKYTVK